MIKSIVKEYDIRGEYRKDLFDTDAYNIGLLFGYKAKSTNQESVVVCRDGRHSSADLSQNLMDGLLDSGIDVYDIGELPTPCLYYAVTSGITDSTSGIMITASHNPKNDNGFKLIFDKKSFFGSDLKSMLTEAYNTETEHENELRKCNRIDDVPRGTLRRLNVVPMYISCVLECNSAIIGGDKKRIAVDMSGGAVCFVFDAVAKKVNADFVLINEKNDPEFSSHDPDPSIRKNLRQLIDAVVSQNCDFGVAFDGDGDRFAIVDENGDVFQIDKLLTILAKDTLIFGKPVVGDTKLSDVFFDTIRNSGIDVLISKTGHPNIKKLLIEKNASFAGEMSGHVFFNDTYYGYDDAIYAFIRFLNILTKKNTKCSSLAAEIQDTYVSQEMRYAVSESSTAVLKKIRKLFFSDEEVTSIEEIDGVKARSERGWMLFRMSNTTENILTLRVEGNSEKDLDSLIDKAKNIIEKVCLQIS